MAYSSEILLKARERFEQAKTERERENEEHRLAAYTQYPRLKEIDLSLRRNMAELIGSLMEPEVDSSQALAAARDKNLALQKEREWIIEAADFEDGYLDDSPICKKCDGRGYIGTQMCSCLRELCRQEQKKALNALIGSGKERFENFRLDCYPDTFQPQLGTSPRKLMQSNLNFCKKYAQTFTPGSGSLLFAGATGLGKTFLSGCIARQLTDRGFSVVYETACKIFADFEAEKFSGGEEAQGLTAKYFHCDLLILDDLGTELTTQFTVSALYRLINGRMLDSKAMLVSTNILPDAIERRYTPQIASRMVGTFRLIKFAGDDIRRL